MTDAMMDFDVGPAQANNGVPHDPGGKVRLPLQPGVRGSAMFSECSRYRYVLRRDWGDAGAPFVLFCMTNPSTAEANVDDPTIRKDIYFTRMMGFTSCVMVNVMDFRATDPKVLLNVNPRSDTNLPFIVDMAGQASRVIVAWGALKPPLRRYADDVVRALAGYQLYCMGRTKDNSPRHPLYLRNDAKLMEWP